MQKKIISALMLLCAFLPFTASAANTLENIGSPVGTLLPNGRVVGFYGAPLIDATGYKAEVGSFVINIGQGALQNVDNVVSSDPDEYAHTANLVAATLILDDIVRIKPKDPSTAPKYGPGTEVGFLVGPHGGDLKVLSIEAIKFMVMYFYNDGEVVGTMNITQDALDVANIQLVKIEDGKQKITAKCPDNIKEFDGIGLGIAGVNATVGSDIRVFYGFVDPFETVPVIKKYYPNSYGAAKFEETTSIWDFENRPLLVNNNLEDIGHSIGGSKNGIIRVVNDEPFPAGVEAGFVFENIDVLLGLSLYSKTEIRLLGYPDGDTTKPLEVIQASELDLSVVKIDLIGGGRSSLSILSEQPFYGIEIKFESVGLDILTGISVYNAYVKLPAVPEEADSPIKAKLRVIPVSTFNAIKSPSIVSAHNVYKNRLYIDVDPTTPIPTLNNGKSVWRYDTESLSVIGAAKPYFCFTLTRTPEGGKEEIVGYIEIYRDVIKHFLTDEIVYKAVYQSKGNPVNTINNVMVNVPIDANGNLDLSELLWIEQNNSTDNYFLQNFDFNTEETPRSFTYKLYYAYPGDSTDDLESAELLSEDTFNIPAMLPTYEIAGNYKADDNDMANFHALDGGIAPGNVDTSHKHYLILDAVNAVDEKLAINDFEVLEYTKPTTGNLLTNHTQLYKFNLLNGHFTSYADLFLGKNNENLMAFIVTDNTRLRYGTSMTTKYTDEFLASFNEAIQKQLKEIDGSTWGWYTSAPGECEMPVLTHKGFAPSATENAIDATYHVALNHATEAHTNVAENMPIIFAVWESFGDAAQAQSQARRVMAKADAGTSYPSQWYNEGNSVDQDITQSLDGSTHVATIVHRYQSEDRDYDRTTAMSTQARAYVPVAPAGFDSDAATYLATNPDSYSVREIQTGIENVAAQAAAEATYFNLQGQKAEALTPGIYIEKRGATTRKVIIK